MELPSWVNVFLGVLTVVTAAGAGISATYVRELRSRVQDLRGEIDDKDRRLRQAEADVLAEKAERKILATEVTALERAIRGDEKLDAIRADGERHHTAAVAYWAKQEKLLGDVLAELKKGGAG